MSYDRPIRQEDQTAGSRIESTMKHERRYFRPIASLGVATFLCVGALNARVLGADLLAWAGPIVDSAIPNGTAIKSTVADRFAHPPAAGGEGESTAGSGSTWVYDRAHGIAAWLENGDLTGSEILYVSSPPGSLPSRDLSHVVSVRGLHLGMPPRKPRRSWAFRRAPCAQCQEF